MNVGNQAELTGLMLYTLRGMYDYPIEPQLWQTMLQVMQRAGLEEAGARLLAQGALSDKRVSRVYQQ